MTANELGCRVDNNISAKLKRSAKIGCGESIVDDKRNAVITGNFSHRFKINNVVGRIAD